MVGVRMRLDKKGIIRNSYLELGDNASREPESYLFGRALWRQVVKVAERLEGSSSVEDQHYLEAVIVQADVLILGISFT